MAPLDRNLISLPAFAPNSAHEAVRALEARYEFMLASGNFEPFVYPWGTVGAAIVILYLLFDHRQSWPLQQLRLPVWLFNTVLSLYTIFYQRARNPAGSLGVGIITAWFILWSSVLLVFDDCQRDFRRIEKCTKQSKAPVSQAGDYNKLQTEGPSPTDTKSLANTSQANGELRSRNATNGHLSHNVTPPSSQRDYYWQEYPPRSISQRFDWVLDVLTTFRGTAWNWRISGLSSPPEHVIQSLPASSSTKTRSQRVTVRTHTTRRALLRHNAYLLTRNMIILDILKTLVSHDPYFWGLVTTTHVPKFIPSALHGSPAAILTIRLLIALGLMKFTLELIFSLGPLFFVGVLPSSLFPVRAETWDHPDQFGDLSLVFDKGLAGWWGGFWHQTFRKGFETPGRKAVAALGLQPGTQTAKLVQLFVAFSLSGLLHACGSMTQIGETRPLRGPFVFFLSQAVGISLEMAAKLALKRLGLLDVISARVGKLANFVFAHWWLYLTAPWLVEDFAKGGVWLFEPLPMSILRGPLRLGDAEDGMWRWHGTFGKWHSSQGWWRSGIAL